MRYCIVRDYSLSIIKETVHDQANFHYSFAFQDVLEFENDFYWVAAI
jgi:hypothetical protein